MIICKLVLEAVIGSAFLGNMLHGYVYKIKYLKKELIIYYNYKMQDNKMIYSMMYSGGEVNSLRLIASHPNRTVGIGVWLEEAGLWERGGI